MLEELVGPLTVTVNQDLEDGTIGKLDYILRYKEIVTMVSTPHFVLGPLQFYIYC